MDWNQILTQLVLWIISGVITAVGGAVIYLIKTRIKDEKIKNILLAGTQVVTDGLNYVQQIYVSNLKGTEGWTPEAMEKANEQAKDYIINNLSDEMKNYLAKNGKDLAEWAQEQIEIAITKAKEKKK